MYEDFILKAKGEENPSLPTPLAQTETPPPPPQEKPATPQSNPLTVPTALPTVYDVYPLDGRHDGGYYSVKDCVTIDVLPRTPGNKVYVGFMVWSNFTATKCRGLISLNQVIKELICLQPLK